MKTCIDCKIEKDLSCFGINNATKDKKHYYCRDCQNQQSKESYFRHREKRLAQKRRKRALLRKQIREWLHSQGFSCVDCGETNYVVLEFDHIDPKEKSCEVGGMLWGPSSLEKIKKEIAKCDIRCSNCHKIRTAKQQGWYKYKETQWKE